jgi:hypothetical protein
VEVLAALLLVVDVAPGFDGGPVVGVLLVDESPQALWAWVRAWSAIWVSVSAVCWAATTAC